MLGQLGRAKVQNATTEKRRRRGPALACSIEAWYHLTFLRDGCVDLLAEPLEPWTAVVTAAAETTCTENERN